METGKGSSSRNCEDAAEQIAATVKVMLIENEFIELQHEMGHLKSLVQNSYKMREELRQKLANMMEQRKSMVSVNEQNKQNLQTIQQHQINLTQYTNSIEENVNGIKERYDAIEKVGNERMSEIKIKLEKAAMQEKNRKAKTEQITERVRVGDTRLGDNEEMKNKIEQEMSRIKNEIEEAKGAEKKIREVLAEQEMSNKEENAKMNEYILEKTKTLESELAAQLGEKEKSRIELIQSRDTQFKQNQSQLKIQLNLNENVEKEIQKLRGQLMDEEIPDSSNEKFVTTQSKRSELLSQSCSIVESSNVGTQWAVPSSAGQQRSGREKDTNANIPNSSGKTHTNSAQYNSPYSGSDRSAASKESSMQPSSSIVNRKYFKYIPGPFPDSNTDDSDVDGN